MKTDSSTSLFPFALFSNKLAAVKEVVMEKRTSFPPVFWVANLIAG
jgi:hypothetical protein